MNCVKIIKSEYPNQKTIYISSVFSNIDSIYFTKKKEIEEYLKVELEDLLIVRLTNIVGCGQNSNNVFPYFRDHIRLNDRINININAIRNILDIDDFIVMLSETLSKSWINDLKIGFFENISALELARIFQTHYGVTEDINIIHGENDFVGLERNENVIVSEYFVNKFSNVNDYVIHLLHKYDGES
jgi:hypothetical protein